jgi:hypothetical protein
MAYPLVVPTATVPGSVFVIVVVVADFVTGLLATVSFAVPEEALWLELPAYLPVMVLVAGSENLAVQWVDPLDRVPWHNFRVPDQNVTVPVGLLPDPLTVADSFTLESTKAFLGLTDTLVFVACLVVCAVEADATPAHKLQVAAATAVTESTRMAPAPRRLRRRATPAVGTRSVAATRGRFSLMRDSS